MSLLLIAAPLLLGFVIAVVLLRRGLRGRAIDDHPVCRACGFDLFNLPSDRAACPECGSEHEIDFANQKVLLRERKDLKADFELLDRQAAPLEIIPDDSPDLRRKVEASILIDSATVIPRTGFIIIRNSAKSPPVPLAFRVTVRQGSSQWQGTRTYDAGGNSNGVFVIPGKGFPGEKVDVIFEPDPDIAHYTVDMPGVWNGRLEYKDVPIRRPPAEATQP